MLFKGQKHSYKVIPKIKRDEAEDSEKSEETE